MARRAQEATQRPHLRLVRADDSSRRGLAMNNKGLIATTVVAALGLTALGLVMVLSASSVSGLLLYGSSFSLFQRQFVYAIVGLVGMLLAAKTPYQVWRRLSLPFLGVTIGLLILVLHPAIGHSAGGSSRWIQFGPFNIQPTEFAKLATIAFAATVLAKRWKRLNDLDNWVVPLLIPLGAVVLLIMLQPDLGTTILVAGITFILLFVAGLRMKYLLAGATGALLMGFVLIMSAGYRRERFFSFLDPWSDPQGSGYQLIQSLIGLASGGFTGVGLGASRQKWMYLPNAHTDFIFSILGEETGLVGEVAVLVLFGVLFFAGIRIAGRAPDTFGRLLGAGVIGWLGLQTIINLGAVTGLLPITGVPLPFVSFGGSSLVICLTAVGILVSIARSGPRGRASRGPVRASVAAPSRSTRSRRSTAGSGSAVRRKPSAKKRSRR